ncbi:MAG: hypothetical protein GX856_07035 [Gammaproteobacteria bacterium]|jgi:hypothetical protein|nr:hypothetical protein [Gammaproteobacteria bacterium]
MHITPKVADALRAFGASTTGELTRCSGGYRPAGAPQCDEVRVTMRTVRAMHTAWLVRLTPPYGSAAELTDKGREALASLQQPRTRARAG